MVLCLAVEFHGGDLTSSRCVYMCVFFFFFVAVILCECAVCMLVQGFMQRGAGPGISSPLPSSSE